MTSRAAMGFESKERFRILFLDKGNHLIADEQHQTGARSASPCTTTSSSASMGMRASKR